MCQNATLDHRAVGLGTPLATSDGMRTATTKLPPYRHITESEVLNRLFQYGVFPADESMNDVVREVAFAARVLRKLRKEHGGDTALRNVVKRYVERERGYVDELRQAVRLAQKGHEHGQATAVENRPRPDTGNRRRRRGSAHHEAR
jgi:hypothetical protein